jgi:regulatory protein
MTETWCGDVTAGVDAWTRRGAPSAPLPPDPVADGPDADHEAVARKILLDQLTGRARTRHELADKLRGRGVPDDLATALLDRFAEVGLVDDAAFARLWVSGRQQSKGLAPRALAQELRRKGIDDETARAALDEVTDDDQDCAARMLVRRRLRTVRGLDQTVAVRRLTGMLARKGYSAGVAFRVVKEELAADGVELDGID